jgi:hypothetical protein
MVSFLCFWLHSSFPQFYFFFFQNSYWTQNEHFVHFAIAF